MKLLFLLLKGASLGKFMLSGGTMVLSVVTYAMVFGWPYDVGFVALFFVMSWVTTLPHGSVISMWACKPKPGSASPARF